MRNSCATCSPSGCCTREGFAPAPEHVGSLGGIQNTAANIAGAAGYAFLLPPVRRLRLA